MSTPAPNNARRQAWSSYWSKGALHSCVGSFEGNYTGPIAGFWRHLAAQLRPDDRVLDLATGNGAIPRLLVQEHAEGAGRLRVDAVDLADLAPEWHSAEQYPDITFHPRVEMELLPFGSATFDWVVSQFGLEYARRREALDECLRVGKPDGGFALVMHHAGSVLVRVGREEARNQTLLLADAGLLSAARNVLPWLARARQEPTILRRDPAAGEARDAYNAAMSRIATEITRSPVPDLLVQTRDWVHRLLAAPTVPVATRLDAIAAHGEALRAAHLRTQEMIDCALDAEAVSAVARHLASGRPGAKVECHELAQKEGVLGWGLLIRPSAA